MSSTVQFIEYTITITKSYHNIAPNNNENSIIFFYLTVYLIYSIVNMLVTTI